MSGDNTGGHGAVYLPYVKVYQVFFFLRHYRSRASRCSTFEGKKDGNLRVLLLSLDYEILVFKKLEL